MDNKQQKFKPKFVKCEIFRKALKNQSKKTHFN